MSDQDAIVGRPTLYAKFSGRQEAATITDKLAALGHPTEDVEVLLRPHGTDAVVDLKTNEPPAGQSGDARLLNETQADTIVLLHPDPAQADAIGDALRQLGATDVQYEGQTVYTGAQSEHDVFGDSDELAHHLIAEIEAVAASLPVSETSSLLSEEDRVADVAADDQVRDEIAQVQTQIDNAEDELENRGK